MSPGLRVQHDGISGPAAKLACALRSEFEWFVMFGRGVQPLAGPPRPGSGRSLMFLMVSLSANSPPPAGAEFDDLAELPACDAMDFHSLFLVRSASASSLGEGQERRGPCAEARRSAPTIAGGGEARNEAAAKSIHGDARLPQTPAGARPRIARSCPRLTAKAAKQDCLSRPRGTERSRTGS